MLKFQLNRTIDLGQIATLIAVLLGAGALYYQSRAVGLSERDLNTKVVQVQDLANSLAAERKQRDSEYLQTLTRSSQILGFSTDNAVNLQLRYSDYFESVALISAALTQPGNRSDSHVLQTCATLSSALSSMVRAEHADMTARSQLFHRSDEQLDSIAKAPGSVALANSKRDEALASLRSDLDRLNKGLAQALAAPAPRYREAKATLVKVLAERKPSQ